MRNASVFTENANQNVCVCWRVGVMLNCGCILSLGASIKCTQVPHVLVITGAQSAHRIHTYLHSRTRGRVQAHNNQQPTTIRQFAHRMPEDWCMRCLCAKLDLHLLRIVCVFCFTLKHNFFFLSSLFIVSIRIRLRLHSFRDYCCWIPFLFFTASFHMYDSIHCIRCRCVCVCASLCGVWTAIFLSQLLLFVLVFSAAAAAAAVQLLANHFATHLLIYSQTMGRLRIGGCWRRTCRARKKRVKRRSAQQPAKVTAATTTTTSRTTNNHNCWL